VRKLGRAGYDFSNADQSGRSLIDTFLQTPVDFALLDVLTEFSIQIDERALGTAFDHDGDLDLLNWFLRHGVSPLATIDSEPIVDAAARLCCREPRLLTTLWELVPHCLRVVRQMSSYLTPSGETKRTC
jgi:hypothetical protein